MTVDFPRREISETKVEISQVLDSCSGIGSWVDLSDSQDLAEDIFMGPLH